MRRNKNLVFWLNIGYKTDSNENIRKRISILKEYCKKYKCELSFHSRYSGALSYARIYVPEFSSTKENAMVNMIHAIERTFSRIPNEVLLKNRPSGTSEISEKELFL